MTQRSKNPIFPNVPKSTEDFRGWHNWAASITNYLSGFVVDRDPPGVITLATPVAIGLGVQLHWTTNHNATAYHVLRNNSNDPTTALVIGILPGRRNVSFFDPVGSSTTAVTLYYWVQPFNENVSGPFSNMGSVLNPVVANGGQLNGLPFGSPVGDGRHGALHITTNTTATLEIPIYQLTNLTIDSGATWTAYASNPGGFFISATGRVKIEGALTAAGRGGAGGAAVSSAAAGKNGFPGWNIAGSAGGGGGATSGADKEGGHGGPCKSGWPISGWSPGGVTRDASTVTSWWGDNSTAQNSQVRREAGSTSNPSGVGGATGAIAGTAGNAVSILGYGMPDLFNVLWPSYPVQIVGFGAGGGSGGFAAGTASGAGGNGGGIMIIMCEEFEFPASGVISVAGSAGGNGSGAGTVAAGGGGGGGGGLILVGYRTLISNAGTLTVTGGSAGTGAAAGGGAAASGGAGGNGFSKVFDMRI